MSNHKNLQFDSSDLVQNSEIARTIVDFFSNKNNIQETLASLNVDQILPNDNELNGVCQNTRDMSSIASTSNVSLNSMSGKSFNINNCRNEYLREGNVETQFPNHSSANETNLPNKKTSKRNVPITSQNTIASTTVCKKISINDSINSNTSSSFKLSPRLKLLIDVTIQSADDEEKFLYGDSSPPSNQLPTAVKNTGAEKNINSLTDFQWSDEEYEDTVNKVELDSRNNDKSFGNSGEKQILNINSNSLNTNKSIVPTTSREKPMSSSKNDSDTLNVIVNQTTNTAEGESFYKFSKANTSIQPVSSAKLSVSLKSKKDTFHQSSNTLLPSNDLEIPSYPHNLKTNDCKAYDDHQKELTGNKSHNKKINRESINDLSVIELSDNSMECDSASKPHNSQSLKIKPFKIKNTRKISIDNNFEGDEKISCINETSMIRDHFATCKSRKNCSANVSSPRTSYKQRGKNARYRSFSRSPRRYCRNISPSSPSRDRSYRSPSRHCSRRSHSKDRSPRYHSRDHSSRYHSRCRSPRYHSHDSLEKYSRDRSPKYHSKSRSKYQSTEKSPEKGSHKKTYHERSQRCRESEDDLPIRKKNLKESKERSRSPQSHNGSPTSKSKNQSLDRPSHSPLSTRIESSIINLNTDSDSCVRTSGKVAKRELNKKKKQKKKLKKVQKGNALRGITIQKIPSVKSNYVTEQSKPNVISEKAPEKDTRGAVFCKSNEQQEILHNCVEISQQNQSQQNSPSDSNANVTSTSVISSQTQPLPPMFNVHPSPFISPYPRFIHPPQFPPSDPYTTNFNGQLCQPDEIHPDFHLFEHYPPEEFNPYFRNYESFRHYDEFPPDFHPRERYSRFPSPRIPTAAPYSHPNSLSRSRDAFLPLEPLHTIHPPVKRIHRQRFSNNKKNLCYPPVKNGSVSTQASKIIAITPPALTDVKRNSIDSNKLTVPENYKELLVEQCILQKVLKNTNVDYSALRNLLANLETQNKDESDQNIIQCKNLFSKSQKEIKATIELLKANHNKVQQIRSKLNPEAIAEVQRVFEDEFAAGKYKPSIPEVECVNSKNDSNDIWCDLCCTECSSVEQLFSHLCSHEHFQQVRSSNQVSLKEPKKLKFTNYVKGVEFLNSVVLFHCKLCRKSLNGETVAHQHLSSEEHISNYMEFLRENPIYEEKRQLLKNVKISRMAGEKLEKDKEEKVIQLAKRQKSFDDKSLKSEHLTDIENEDIKEVIEDENAEEIIKDNDIKEVIEDEDIKVSVVNNHTRSELTNSVTKTESKD